MVLFNLCLHAYVLKVSESARVEQPRSWLNQSQERSCLNMCKGLGNRLLGGGGGNKMPVLYTRPRKIKLPATAASGRRVRKVDQ